MITEKDIDLEKFKEYMATSGHNLVIETDRQALVIANNLAAIPDSVRRTTDAICNKPKQKVKSSPAG